MRDLGQRYGVTEREFEAVGDHRIIRLLNDFAQLLSKTRAPEKVITKAAKRRVQRRVQTRRNAQNTDQLVQAASKSTDQGVKQDAISKLLSN